ncbi:metallo-beta-lactamase superfamily protein [Methanohalobium evestigatum Z-7303]|uniref:Metallo-beta-lactamase superfamily protein n=1 Tax=Methanohalobium evestigatum (strain ATCC BAA-1072 / DSM 3721 / NBRC 107634 / OCM 161 / Z-7303) TaxID=644295 RepID=D7EBS9_METEZ|nr:MBL fold metallo-hydrolase [Methanohalobium evestigatum]ADI74921.1 metallo-beta-lactamase superfamily protein [Methanohalobium evestigatum Z-7303]
MKLTVVYDNNAINGFLSGWGFSCLIDTGQSKILFDTGWDGYLLIHNLKMLDVSPLEIGKVVLSHHHWDHMGGLTSILNANPDLEVYVPESFSKYLKDEISSRAKLIEISQPTEIHPSIYTTGKLGNKIKEQALLLETSAGVYVITGCAHPGLTNIMEKASVYGDVAGIIGGLHGSEEYNLLKNLKLIAAGHCTSNKNKIAKLYPDSFMEIGSGVSIHI